MTEANGAWSYDATKGYFIFTLKEDAADKVKHTAYFAPMGSDEVEYFTVDGENNWTHSGDATENYITTKKTYIWKSATEAYVVKTTQKKAKDKEAEDWTTPEFEIYVKTSASGETPAVYDFKTVTAASIQKAYLVYQ